MSDVKFLPPETQCEKCLATRPRVSYCVCPPPSERPSLEAIQEGVQETLKEYIGRNVRDQTLHAQIKASMRPFLENLTAERMKAMPMPEIIGGAEDGTLRVKIPLEWAESQPPSVVRSLGYNVPQEIPETCPLTRDPETGKLGFPMTEISVTPEQDTI